MLYLRLHNAIVHCTIYALYSSSRTHVPDSVVRNYGSGGAPIPCSNVKASTSSCSQQTEGGLSNDATIIRPTATCVACGLPFYGRLKLWGSKSSSSDRHAYYYDNFCNNCVIPCISTGIGEGPSGRIRNRPTTTPQSTPHPINAINDVRKLYFQNYHMPNWRL